tara:strand:+ start:73 stop:189 length:117 start_codon:yes stop_codon:yes gene_type:complete
VLLISQGEKVDKNVAGEKKGAERNGGISNSQTKIRVHR